MKHGKNFFCTAEKVWETATVYLAIADPTDTDIPNTVAQLQHSVISDMLYKNKRSSVGRIYCPCF